MPKHARKHEAHPHRVKKKKKRGKKEFRLDLNEFGFKLSWRTQHGQFLNKRLIQSESFVANLLLFDHQQKTVR